MQSSFEAYILERSVRAHFEKFEAVNICYRKVIWFLYKILIVEQRGVTVTPRLHTWYCLGVFHPKQAWQLGPSTWKANFIDDDAFVNIQYYTHRCVCTELITCWEAEWPDEPCIGSSHTTVNMNRGSWHTFVNMNRRSPDAFNGNIIAWERGKGIALQGAPKNSTG